MGQSLLQVVLGTPELGWVWEQDMVVPGLLLTVHEQIGKFF